MCAGGAERVISELVTYFDSQNIECYIIKLSTSEVFYTLPVGVKVISIGRKSNVNIFDKIRKYKEARRVIKKITPDIVLAMPEEVGIYTIPALFCTNIPIVVSERNNPNVMPWKKITRALRKLMYPFASGFIFQTTQAADYFPQQIKNKSKVLLNPLNIKKLPEKKVGNRNKEIIAAGRLDTQKNFFLLIDVFKEVRNIHKDYTLKIYGDGPLKNDLIAHAEKLLPKGSFKFPGQDKNLLTKLCDAQVFVLSSDYEGMPNVLIEAMAMGMPVVATDCPSGGPSDLIKDGFNGLLVPTNNVDAMTKAVLSIIESEKFSIELGNNAKTIRNRIDSTIVSQQWLDYLVDTTKRNS